MPRPSRRLVLAALAVAALPALALGACGGDDPTPPQPMPEDALVTAAGVTQLVGALAADSMEGRFPGTIGERRAATLIAAAMAGAGLEPAGDSGWFQRVPVRLVLRTMAGRQRMAPYPVASWDEYDALPAGERAVALNVVGRLPGSHATARDSAVLLTAHYDHIGIGAPVNGDSIYNGADDNASGTMAILETARVLAADASRPRRSIVFVAFTAEEEGMVGSRWYALYPAVPLARTTSNLNIEMITRPDGARGAAWLSGYERSTMGPQLAAAGLPVRPDVRPELDIFWRSDNIVFAYEGIPAHTLSTWNLHTDYHKPSDESRLADGEHMASVVRTVVRAARLLANGAVPTWNSNGQP